MFLALELEHGPPLSAIEGTPGLLELLVLSFNLLALAPLILSDGRKGCSAAREENENWILGRSCVNLNLKGKGRLAAIYAFIPSVRLFLTRLFASRTIGDQRKDPI